MFGVQPSQAARDKSWVGPFPEPFQTKIATIFYAEAILGRYGRGGGFFGKVGNVRGVVENEHAFSRQFPPGGAEPKITTGSITP